VNYEDVVFAIDGNNHSWIVLQNTAMGCEFLIDCQGRYPQNPNCAAFWFSNLGFTKTAGTATTRPTADDENGRDLHWGPGGYWTFSGDYPQAFDCVLHVMTSSDGKGTRWFAYYNHYILCGGFIDRVEDAASGWATPNIFQWGGNNFGSARYPFSKEGQMYASYSDPAQYPYAMHGTIKGHAWLSTEGYGNVGYLCNWIPFRNEISGKWDFTKVGVWSATAGMRGILGRMADIYVKPSLLSVGTSFPEDGSRIWMSVCDFILPWNGTELVTY
jgi:hypothetical protein